MKIKTHKSKMSTDDKIAVILSSILAVSIGIIIWLVHPVEKTGWVNSMFWERTIYMEEYMKVEHSGNYLPSGAELIAIENRSKRVQTGSDSNGNPIYSTRHYNYYRYYLQEWQENNVMVRTCGFDNNPYWDEEEAESKVKHTKPNSETLGDTRIGKRTEEYSITFNEYNKDHEIKERKKKVNLNQFTKYEIGSEETYKVAWIAR